MGSQPEIIILKPSPIHIITSAKISAVKKFDYSKVLFIVILILEFKLRIDRLVPDNMEKLIKRMKKLCLSFYSLYTSCNAV